MKEAKKVFFIYLGEQWAFILLVVFALSWIIYKNYIGNVFRYVDKMVGLLIVVVVYLFIQLIIKFQKEEKQKLTSKNTS